MGQIRIREEGSTPSTPTQGVVLYPTVATPSILKLLDDAGALTTFALLEKAQTFTAANTFTGGQTIAPVSTGLDGLIVNMPASTAGYAVIGKYNGTTRVNVLFQSSVSYLEMVAYDAGNPAIAPQLRIGRNNNATTPSAGVLVLYAKDGTPCYYWTDAGGNFRISTSAAPTTTVSDTSGTVVGTQVSSLDTKDVIEEFTENEGALGAIVATPLYRFRYKSGMYGQDFVGVITDYAPLFGMDRDEDHPAGKSLNEINAHGYEMAAIKALAAQVQELQEQVRSLTARLSALERD